MVYSAAALATLAMAVSSASAHLVMTAPTPYRPKDNSPLSRDGTMWPCKNDGFEVVRDNAVTAGTSIPVSFDGSATHGGGVCQFSVNYDETPSEDPARWKVIHTIIGGCPAESNNDNIDPQTPANNEFGQPGGVQCGDATGENCMRTFDIPLPSDLQNGKAHFAWTWFNKVGNREMYMMCAPITVSGGSDDSAAVDALPQVYVQNAGPQFCETPLDGQWILNIPDANRGSSVVNNDPADSPAFDDPRCGAQGEAGAAAPAAPAEEPAEAAPVEEEAPIEKAPLEVETPAAEPPAPAPAAGGSSTCTTDGALICISETEFGICSRGSAVAQAVAAGTTCQNGAIVKKRSIGQHANRNAKVVMA